MFKFNVFSLYLFLLHKVSLSCSPINSDKYKAEFRRRMESKKPIQEYNINKVQPNQCQLEINKERDQKRTFVWSILLSPIRVYRLMKSYHMAGNKVFAIHFLYIGLLIHLFVKSIIHSVVTGEDKEMMAYFDSIYYPHLASISPHPYFFNNLLIAFLVYTLTFRLRSLFKLVRLSILNSNKDSYGDLSITQLNFSYLSSFKLGLKEWRKLWKQLTEHDKMIRSSRETFIKHLSFNRTIHNESKYLCERDLVFGFNLIDYDECYSKTVLRDSEKRKRSIYPWHISEPIDRMSPCGLRQLIIVAIVATLMAIANITVGTIALILTEVANTFPAHVQPTIWECVQALPSHLKDPLNWVRIFELFVIALSQLPQINDAIVVSVDIHIIDSRIHKLMRIFKVELEICKEKARSLVRQDRRNSGDGGDNRSRSPSVASVKQLEPPIKQEDNEIVRNFNIRVRHNLKLTRLVYLEFLNLRKNHTGILNLGKIFWFDLKN